MIKTTFEHKFKINDPVVSTTTLQLIGQVIGIRFIVNDDGITHSIMYVVRGYYTDKYWEEHIYHFEETDLKLNPITHSYGVEGTINALESAVDGMEFSKKLDEAGDPKFEKYSFGTNIIMESAASIIRKQREELIKLRMELVR